MFSYLFKTLFHQLDLYAAVLELEGTLIELKDDPEIFHFNGSRSILHTF